MAQLTTAQKAPLVVTDPATGLEVPDAELVGFVTVDNAVIAIDATDADNLFVLGQIAGSSRVLVNLPDGRAGALTVEVTPAPLVITLGEPEAK